MTMLGIGDCANTVVGDEMLKGISGGQKACDDCGDDHRKSSCNIVGRNHDRSGLQYVVFSNVGEKTLSFHSNINVTFLPP